MFSFTQQSISPALKAQLDAQFSFFTDMSKNMFESAQRVNQLNMQVAATMMDESLTGLRQLMSATNQNEALSIVAGQSQPATEKVRAYQQHLQKIIADSQADMTKTIAAHAPESTRKAEAVVREFAQRAAEETSKVTQRQKESLEKLTTLAAQNVERTAQGNNLKVPR